MAVYKPTLCYPFLNGLDIRTAVHKDSSTTPVDFLSCKIDTSNKNITGYQLKIYTSDNQLVFPLDGHDYISPISELQIDSCGYTAGGTNSGVNGTTLQIPFFQNLNKKIVVSRNAIYYNSQFIADHVIYASGMSGVSKTPTTMEDIDNWSISNDQLIYTWPGATEEEKNKNAITLDGERIMNGDIIAVVSNTASNKCGIWKVTFSNSGSNSGTMQTVLERFNSVSQNRRITIIKGAAFHNSNWKCLSTASATTNGAFEYSHNGGAWLDSTGSALPLVNCDDMSYKWEITLYQGNHTTIADPSGYGTYIEYNDVDPDWLDMTLMSGSILGSTPERIQIGSDNTSTGIIPEGTTADPLVLQGKYMELSHTAPSDTLSGNLRIYVKTYDATYGHVYPLTGAIGQANIDNAEYCQFFEHSTDPNDILDTDIVDYCLAQSALTFKYYKLSSGVWTPYGSDETSWLNNTSSLERYITIDTLPAGLSEGGTILLTNQSLPKQNGVYTVYSVNNGAGTSKICLKRAASYESWSDYLGKVIYTTNGDNGRRNMSSLAQSGSYTLWNPLSTTSGSSSLYFVPERPILLFQNKLAQNGSFNLYDKDRDRPPLGYDYSFSSTIDGIVPIIGDIIVYADGKYGTVIEKTPYSYKLSDSYGYGTLSSGDYVRITNGQQYGSLVLKWTVTNSVGSFSKNWDLFTARILKNSDTQTFISPWSRLQKNMKLALLNNTNVYYKPTGGSTYTVDSKWITINDFNDNLYYITHPSLSTVAASSTPTPIASYSSTDTSIPWKYDVRYFFRTSDENPFTSYETPYLRLYKNGEIYSDLSMLGVNSQFYVTSSESSSIYEKFLDRNNKNFIVTLYTSQSGITGRSIQLSADYVQFGQSSWESYRWILYNADGDIVQDTGKCYNKDINVVFYGLSNDGTEAIAYDVVLLLENDSGDTFEYVIELKVVSGSQSTFITNDGSFTAEFDITTHSNILTYEPDSSTSSLNYSIYRREYEVLQRPGNKVYGYYNSTDGNFYADSDFTILLTGLSVNKQYVDLATGYVYEYHPAESYNFGPDPALTYKIYKSEWEPVLVKDTRKTFRDFNITNGRTYQYIIYPGEDQVVDPRVGTAQQTFANSLGKIWQIDSNEPTQGSVVYGSLSTSALAGEAVSTNWNCWSIVELVPEDTLVDAPIVRKQYKVNNENIWLFKYGLTTGSQTQNISREEFQTLGEFPQYGFGALNADSGEVTAQLGSEIVPISKAQYIERIPQSRIAPLSTNEKAEMLKQWRQFVYSKNPKLLKDIKGQSWIVQIISNNNTTKNFYFNSPDTISFTWKQVDTTKNVIIYGDYTTSGTGVLDSEVKSSVGEREWNKLYNGQKTTTSSYKITTRLSNIFASTSNPTMIRRNGSVELVFNTNSEFYKTPTSIAFVSGATATYTRTSDTQCKITLTNPVSEVFISLNAVGNYLYEQVGDVVTIYRAPYTQTGDTVAIN